MTLQALWFPLPQTSGKRLRMQLSGTAFAQQAQSPGFNPWHGKNKTIETLQQALN